MTKRNIVALLVTLACLAVVATEVSAQGISVDLGKTTTGRYMNLVGNTGDGAVQDMIILSPEYCAKNLGTSMYFAIADDFFSQLSGTFIILNVEYYDTLAVDINLFYDDVATHGKQHASKITTTGSNKWKSYSFLIDDAYFNNGLTNSADFKLTSTGTMFINAVSVVPFDKYINFGDGPAAGGVNDSDDVFGVTHNEYQGGDSKTKYELVDGEWCITGEKDNQYLYCGIDDTYINGGNHPYVFVAVEYYDADPLKTFRLQYDHGTSDRYKSTQTRGGKGWNSFRTYTFEIPDAVFANNENGLSDMRLQLYKPGLMINRVTVGILPKKPLPNTASIANQTAFKYLEAPTVDGNVSDWSWLVPYALVPQFNTDLTRRDEFYRTWLLNNTNVPVVEVGEPGVTAPTDAGMWDQNDLTGWFRMGWDDTKMYFAVVVKDNVTDVTGSNWSEKDGFGFYLDVSHSYTTSGGVQVPVAIKDDPNFQAGEQFFFLTASNSELGWWRHSTSPTGEALPNTVTKTVVATDSGYIIEASIPLSLLKDGLAWNPGVLGDKDNFSPLFSYMINDADNVGASSGRLMFGGHNDDDEFWGALTMAPAPMVDRGVMVDLGTTNYENLMTQVEKGGDGLTTPIERQGKKAVQLGAGYAYFDVNDAVVNGNHRHLLISVEYLDTVAGDQFRVQYDGLTSPYTDSPWITTGNTNTWKTAIIELTDANFASSENGRADFRIHSQNSDLIINQVRVALADLWLDLGDSTGIGIREMYPGSDGLREGANVGGNACKVNAVGAGYMYFSVADSIIYNGNHREVFLTTEYYDTASTAAVALNYEGMGNLWSNAEGNAFVLGTNQWKLHSFYLNDAKFANGENGQSDFRINSQGSTALFVHRLFIGSIDPLITAVEGSETVPVTFDLAQNYPNPFNPSTTIKYSVPTSGMVSLKIYNILGQEVASLVSAMQAAGHYTVRWNASQQSTGMYLCRLTQNAKVMTQKLVLVK
ncbi:MAG: sugar-binding protein [Bacteroidota bacterium]